MFTLVAVLNAIFFGTLLIVFILKARTAILRRNQVAGLGKSSNQV